MSEERICPFCKKSFSPSKYRKDQKVCSQRECQHQRQLENLSAWREKNSGYFKVNRHNSSWAKLYRRRSLSWRKKHKKMVREYKQRHKREHREYMREYMYRLRHPAI